MIQKFKILIFLLFVFSCSHNLHWPQDHELSCHAKPSIQNNAESIPSFHFDATKISSQLKAALERYQKGEVGNKSKILNLENLSAQKIHQLLLDHQFRYSIVPLRVHPQLDPNRYWLRNGETQMGIPSQKRALPMIVYDHHDGSVVRVKAWGIPDPAHRTFRPQPHVSRSVVFDTKEACAFFYFNCHINTDWENEAFKISNTGTPLPKSPSQNDGMNFPKTIKSQEAKRQFIDNVMNQAHMDLPIHWQHCKK